MKKTVQALIRKTHLKLFKKSLPDKIGIYLHSVEKPDHNKIIEMVSVIRDLGYKFSNIEEFISSNEKTAYLSFDDNYRSWYFLLKLFEDLRIHATFYTNSLPFRDISSHGEILDYYKRIDHSGEKEGLSTNELKEIAASGHTIGSHTHSHFCLTKISVHAAQEEIKLNKRILEDLLCRKIEHFSYPFGMRRHFNSHLRKYCLNIGFKTIAGGIPAMQYKKQVPMELNRSQWNLKLSPKDNIENICVDGRIFEKLTGLSAVG